MAHLPRQPILSPGTDVFALPPQRIAGNAPASSSRRVPAASFGLDRFVTMPMTYQGSAPALGQADRGFYE